MKVLFMGTPAFAAVSLEALLNAGHEIVAAVTRPDTASGRGLRTRSSAVKELASAHGLAVLQPEGVRGASFLRQVESLRPDIIVVAAFGRILPRGLLCATPLGAVNVHASLLPRWRGAAPIAWAIARGDAETGVTIMKMVERLDAGDILSQRSTVIRPEETAGDLEARLASIGSSLLVETMPILQAGSATPVPQDDAEASYAPMLTKEDGVIDWSRPAEEIARKVRAFNPWPGAQTRTPRGRRLLIWKAAGIAGARHGAACGTVVRASTVLPGAPGTKGTVVACGEGTALLLVEVQPEGRRRMPTSEAVSGRHLGDGDRLGGA